MADITNITRPLPGSGYLNASKTALDELARAMERERAWGADASGQRVVRHQADLDREQREREEAAEAERKAGPDPRAVLTAAHQLQAEAQAEVDRLAPLLERARELVRNLEDQARDRAAAVKAGEAAVVDALIERITGGELAPDLDETVIVTVEEAIATKLRLAKAALARLEDDATKANDLLTRRHAGVERCARSVMVDQAAALADAILEDDRALRQRRAELDTLARLLTDEGRRLDRVPTPLPAQITRAIYPDDPVLTGADRGLALTNWRAEYDRLCRGEGHP